MTKLSISKAWDESKQVITRDGSLLTAVALALFVLPGVVTDLVAPATPPGEIPKFGAWTFVTGLMLVIALAGQIAVIGLASGSRMMVGQAITHGARRVPAYLLATLMWLLPFIIVGLLLVQSIRDPEHPSLAAALGLLLLIGVLLFVAVRLLLTSAVASNEEVGPLAILRSSWDLTRGHWWRLFGFFVVILGTALIAVYAVSAIGGILAKLIFGATEPLTVGGLVVALQSQIVSAAVSVVLMVMLARIYVQLAGRGEAEASVPTTGS